MKTPDIPRVSPVYQEFLHKAIYENGNLIRFMLSYTSADQYGHGRIV